jgi:hypothetical protein
MEFSLEAGLTVVAARAARTAVVTACGPGTAIVAAGARWGQTLLALKQLFGRIADPPILARH